MAGSDQGGAEPVFLESRLPLAPADESSVATFTACAGFQVSAHDKLSDSYNDPNLIVAVSGISRTRRS